MLKLLPIFICKGRKDTAQLVKMVGSQIRQRLIPVRALWWIVLRQVAEVRVAMCPVTIVQLEQLANLPQLSYIVIGGLIASTVLAMFLVPPFYLLMRGERVDGSKRPPLFKKKKCEKGSAEAALSTAGSNTDET